MGSSTPCIQPKMLFKIRKGIRPLRTQETADLRGYVKPTDSKCPKTEELAPRRFDSRYDFDKVSLRDFRIAFPFQPGFQACRKGSITYFLPTKAKCPRQALASLQGGRLRRTAFQKSEVPCAKATLFGQLTLGHAGSAPSFC